MMTEDEDQGSKTTLIFLHVPKTAGTTLSHIIARQYDPQEIFHIRNPAHPRGPRYSEWAGTVEDLRELVTERRAGFRCVIGHAPFGVHEHLPGPCRYVTLLRKPVARVLSQHRQFVHHNIANETIGPDEAPTLAEFLEIQPIVLENRQTVFVAGMESEEPVPDEGDLERARENMREHFQVVGTLERFDEFLVVMSREFGWPNVLYVPLNRTREVTDPLRLDQRPDLVRGIEAKSALDQALYAEATRCLNESIARYGSGFRRDLRRFRRANRAHQRAEAGEPLTFMDRMNHWLVVERLR